MRNTTMLKHLLIKYDILFTMDEGEYFKIVITDKSSHESEIIEGKTYSEILRKAYSYMLKHLSS